MLLILFISINCKGNTLQKRLVSEEYGFPRELIGNGKTMVYLYQNTNDTVYLNLFNYNYRGQNFFIQSYYDKNSISDSFVLLNNKLVDYYTNLFEDGVLWKSNPILDTLIFDNGVAKEVQAFRWGNDSMYASVKEETHIVKDTVLNWQDKQYKGIVTNSIIETNSNFKQSPDGSHYFKMEITCYLCKNIGVIKRIITFNWLKEPIVSDLIEIRELKK